MSELHFAEPQWLYVAGVVGGVLLALVALDRRGGRALERLVGTVLQPRLVSKPTALRRRLQLALLGLSALSLVVALMRPQWGVEFVKSPQIGAEIMIAIDVSRSPGDRSLYVVLRDRVVLRLLDCRCESWVRVDIGATRSRSRLDALYQFGEQLSPLGILATLAVLDIGPF